MGALTQEELTRLEDTLTKKAGEVVETVQKALKDEVEKFNGITTKTNEKLTEVSTSAAEAQKAVKDFKLELLEVQQKLAKRPSGGDERPKTPGQIFVASDQLRAAVAQGAADVAAVNIGAIPWGMVDSIINATGQNQPLVPDMRVPGIVTAANRRLTIRDLIPNLRTSSNLVQFAYENVFTNNAALQFNSPDETEGATKAQSTITFALANQAVETIAHWIAASRQILADAGMLQGYIDSRLMYGLKLAEETQFLTGDGTAGNLDGLLANATAYNRGASNDTRLDALLKAILQVAISEYAASGMVLNPVNWTDIQLMKDTTGRYLFTDPQSVTTPRLWGLPIVATNSMTSGQFLVGAFDLAAAIFDREDATIRVSEHHASFFVQNLVAILCEERTTIVVFRSASMVKGTFPAVGT